MEDKDKEIERLQRELAVSRESWGKLFREKEELLKDLEFYKKLVKAQSDIINK